MDSLSKRVLITGASGFTGQYICRLLKGSGVLSIPLDDEVDLRDAKKLASAICNIRPTHVIHLAAISFVAHADPNEIYATNALGTRNLLEALTASGSSVQRVVLASSANIYGQVATLPITEETLPRPQNDYAASKVAMEAIASVYSPTLPITILRPFNYTGPGQQGHFLVPKIVEHFKNRAPKITLGNVDVARDFSDVRDIARVYVDLLDRDLESGTTLNFCSGRSVRLREIIDLLEGTTGHKIDIEVDTKLVRKSDILNLVGSSVRLRTLTNYEEQYSFDQTLRDMLR